MKNPYLYLTAKRVLQQIDSDERTWTELLLLFRRLLPVMVFWIVSLPLTQSFVPWIEEHPQKGHDIVLCCAFVVDFLSKLLLQSREDGNDVLLKYLPGSGKRLTLRYVLSFFRLVNLNVLAMASWSMLATSAFPHTTTDILFCIAAGWFNTIVAAVILRMKHQHDLRRTDAYLLWIAIFNCNWMPGWAYLSLILVSLVVAYWPYKRAFRYPDYHEATAGQGIKLDFFRAGVPKLVLRQLLSPSLKWAVLLMLIMPLFVLSNPSGSLPLFLICIWGGIAPIFLGELGFTPESTSADGLMVWQKKLMLKILHARMWTAAGFGTLCSVAACCLSPAGSRIPVLVGCLYFMMVAFHTSFPVAAFLKQRWDISSKQRRVIYCYYNLVEIGLLALGAGLYWLLAKLEAHWAVTAAIVLLLGLLLPVSSRSVYNRFYKNRHSFLTAFRKD